MILINSVKTLKFISKKLSIAGILFIFVSSSMHTIESNRPWAKHFDGVSPSIELPKVHHLKINNVQVYYLQYDLIPKASIKVCFEGGEVEESDSRRGITNLWGESLVFSGSNSMGRDQLAEYIEQRGSSLSFSASLERSSISLSSLSGYFQDDLQVLFDLLIEPRFEPKDIDIIKKNLLKMIETRDENPGQLANYLNSMKIFPANPRSALATRQSINNLKAQDLKEWHQRLVTQSRLTVLLAGDIDMKAIAPWLKNNLGKISKSGPMPDKSILKRPIAAKDQLAFLGEKNIPQSTLVLSAKGMAHHEQDYIGLRLFNHLLGGDSFNSALTKNIRTKHGWAYSTYSSFTTDRYTGTIYLFAQTANKNVPNVLREMKRLLLNPGEYVTPKSLEMAKISLRNRFVFLYERPEQYLDLWMNLRWEGLGEDYLATLVEKTNAITLQQVLEIAKKYYRPENFHLTIVGPRSVTDEKVDPFYSSVKEVKLPE